MLAPISGVFNDVRNPRRPIAEALSHQPNDVDAELYAARAWAEQADTKAAIAAVPGLAAEMAMAVWLYTCETDLYKKLNAALRNGDRAELMSHYFPYIRLLLEALQLIKRAQGGGTLTVNRGVKLDLVAMHPSKYAEGKTVVWWEFTSTTLSVSLLQKPTFLGQSGPRTIFQIQTTKGINIQAFSAIKSESEVLLPAACVLTITGVAMLANGPLRMVTCKDANAPALIKL
eukprot:7391425-Prymnesium_polylepis.2